MSEPVVSDAAAGDAGPDAPFWAGAEQGRLVVQKCGNCGYLRWPPGPICPQCQSADAAWTAVRPHGVLETYATYHRAFNPAFKDRVPYTVGMILLDDGPRMIGPVTNAVEDLEVGRPVQAAFEPLADGRAFPAWSLED